MHYNAAAVFIMRTLVHFSTTPTYALQQLLRQVATTPSGQGAEGITPSREMLRSGLGSGYTRAVVRDR